MRFSVLTLVRRFDSEKLHLGQQDCEIGPSCCTIHPLLTPCRSTFRKIPGSRASSLRRGASGAP
eukprot:5045130-Pleurochrysis_carterae.AAC.2